MTHDPPHDFDALVIGAGFGGLGAALSLAERGARVCLCEALRYPGGCASTFSREGFRFDAGATLVSGLDPAQPFGRWLSRYDLPLALSHIDPLVELRAPGLTLEARRDRAALPRALSALPHAPRERISAFFAQQKQVADALWPLFEDDELLPPFGLASLARHATRLGRYGPLLPLIGKPLTQLLDRHGLASFEPLRIYADALCQITLQCPSREAETPFALAAFDYYHRGTAHVEGGVGALADALLEACRRAGVEVRLSCRAQAVHPDSDGFTTQTRRGAVRSRAVVANLLPAALERLLPAGSGLPRQSASLGREVMRGWGAVMLYMAVKTPDRGRPEAHHLELVADPSRPFTHGNHVFMSISAEGERGRAPPGLRVITASTHVPLDELREAGEQRGELVDRMKTTMRATIAALAPGWASAVQRELSASPRTFERFTGRPEGAVGGIPRRAGLSRYSEIGPHQVRRGLYLVGDSVFPGQSALAAAVGGARTAVAVARELR